MLMVLPGRGGAGIQMHDAYLAGGIKEPSVFEDHSHSVSLTPEGYKWYPMPNGANDQRDAISGIPRSVEAIRKQIDVELASENLSHDKLVISGFSAGGVMGLAVFASYLRNGIDIGAVFCHSGAILNASDFPKLESTTHLFVFHGMKDDCFSCEERYVPMKRVLIDRGYHVTFVERFYNYHDLDDDDIDIAEQHCADRYVTDHTFELNEDLLLDGQEEEYNHGEQIRRLSYNRSALHDSEIDFDR